MVLRERARGRARGRALRSGESARRGSLAALRTLEAQRGSAQPDTEVGACPRADTQNLDSAQRSARFPGDGQGFLADHAKAGGAYALESTHLHAAAVGDNRARAPATPVVRQAPCGRPYAGSRSPCDASGPRTHPLARRRAGHRPRGDQPQLRFLCASTTYGSLYSASGTRGYESKGVSSASSWARGSRNAASGRSRNEATRDSRSSR